MGVVDAANCYNWRTDHYDLARESGVPALHSTAEIEVEKAATTERTDTSDDGMGTEPTAQEDRARQAALRR